MVCYCHSAIAHAMCALLDEALGRNEKSAREDEAHAREFKALADEKNALARKNEALARENEALAHQMNALVRENEALAHQMKALARENQALADERNALARENEAHVRVNDALVHENGARARNNEEIVASVIGALESLEPFFDTAMSYLDDALMHLSHSMNIFKVGQANQPAPHQSPEYNLLRNELANIRRVLDTSCGQMQAYISYMHDQKKRFNALKLCKDAQSQVKVYTKVLQSLSREIKALDHADSRRNLLNVAYQTAQQKRNTSMALAKQYTNDLQVLDALTTVLPHLQPTVTTQFVRMRTGRDVRMRAGRDVQN